MSDESWDISDESWDISEQMAIDALVAHSDVLVNLTIAYDDGDIITDHVPLSQAMSSIKSAVLIASNQSAIPADDRMAPLWITITPDTGNWKQPDSRT